MLYQVFLTFSELILINIKQLLKQFIIDNKAIALTVNLSNSASTPKARKRRGTHVCTHYYINYIDFHNIFTAT